MSKDTTTSQLTIKGTITVEGIRTTYEPDGRTVADQKAVLKLNKGILSKRFLVPLTLFDVDELTKAMAADSGFFPADTEMKFTDVKPVEGRFRMYEATVASVIKPISKQTLEKLVASGVIAKDAN